MKAALQTLSDRKHRVMLDAARSLFLKRGYDGTSMEEIAVRAGVSKQTVYKHFADKKRLFEEIVLATTAQVDQVVGMISNSLAATKDLEKDLTKLARGLMNALMEPQLLRLRRIVIANAELMPEMGRSWYEQGFERVLATLATCFERLSAEQVLDVQDPMLAANHFAGLLLWIPINEVMFTGSERAANKAALDRCVSGAVRVFLAGYTSAPQRRRAKM
jgi:TetR/AcrR family transcriptional regulator, mexJK operon transcriptional repressor